VSYRRSDSPHASGRVRDRLATAFGNDNIFFDVDSIPFGNDFRAAIRAAIASVDVVLVMIGPGFDVRRLNNQRDPIRDELLESFRQKKIVVPVLIDAATMPTPETLPRVLQRLSYLNASLIRPDPDFHRDAERLLTSIQQAVGARQERPADDANRSPAAVEIATSVPVSPVIRNELTLIKVDEQPLSAWLKEATRPLQSVRKGRSLSARMRNAAVVVNDGTSVHELWAHFGGGTLQLGARLVFDDPRAQVTTVHGSALAWLSGDHFWVRPSREQDPVPVPMAKVLKRQRQKITHLAFVGSGSRLAVATNTKIVVIDVPSGELVASVPVPNAFTHYGVDSMWSTEDGRLVTSKYASQVMWDQNLSVIASLDDFGMVGHYVSHANAVDSSGTFFAAAAMPSTLAVIDTRRKLMLPNLTLPAGEGVLFAGDIAFHPDYGNVLVCMHRSGALVGCNMTSRTVTILSNESRRWEIGLFVNTEIFAAIDDQLKCTLWRADFV
jgi:hypothetical protein